MIVVFKRWCIVFKWLRGLVLWGVQGNGKPLPEDDYLSPTFNIFVWLRKKLSGLLMAGLLLLAYKFIGVSVAYVDLQEGVKKANCVIPD